MKDILMTYIKIVFYIVLPILLVVGFAAYLICYFVSSAAIQCILSFVAAIILGLPIIYWIFWLIENDKI